MDRKKAISLLKSGPDGVRRLLRERPRQMVWADDEEVERLEVLDLAGAELQGASLIGADLRFVNLDRADLRNADLTNANLEGSLITNARLTHARLAGANLSPSHFDGSNLDSADLRGVKSHFLLDFQGGSLVIVRPSYVGSSLLSTDFSNADLSMSDFRYADLRHSKMQDSNLQGAHLVGAKLQDIDLKGAIISAEHGHFQTHLPAEFVLPDSVRVVRSGEEYRRGIFYTPSGTPFVQHRVTIARSPDLLDQHQTDLLAWLSENPRRFIDLGPDRLEQFVIKRLLRSGIAANRVGSLHTPDGGIDIVARIPGPIEYLLAVQIESHDAWHLRTGLAKVQRLAGAVAMRDVFQFGLIVTNTSFTRNALAFVDRFSPFLRRAAYSELCQWLTGNLVTEPRLDAVLPTEITLPGGPKIALPDSCIYDQFGQPLKGYGVR